MSLIRWSPFFFEPFDSMDKFMESLPAVGSQTTSKIVPPIDMYETDSHVIVETPIVGVDPNKIDISIDNGMLSIKGSSERKTEVDEKNYYHKEVRYGTVFRQIALPTQVQEDKADASFDNGVLRIQIPKRLNHQAKSVKVEIKKR